MVIKQVCLALKHLNEKVDGTVHLDLKADNLLVGTGGIHDVRLCDYGTCTRLGEGLERECPANIGTTTYRAPELWNAILSKGWSANAPITPKADIWSLGCLFYFIMAKAPCFTETMKGLPFFLRISKGEVDYEPITQLNGGPSTPCMDLMKSMLTLDVKERFDAKQVLNTPWIIDQNELLHDCTRNGSSETHLFGVPLGAAVERSDIHANLVPSPIVSCIEWLRPTEAGMRATPGNVDRTVVNQLIACFNVDYQYKIPQDTQPQIVVAIMVRFIQLLVYKDGRPVTILGGDVARDHAVSKQIGGCTKEEQASKIRSILEALKEHSPANVATVDYLCRFWNEQMVWQVKEGTKYPTNEAFARSTAMNYAASVREIIAAIILTPSICDGLTPASRARKWDEAKYQEQLEEATKALQAAKEKELEELKQEHKQEMDKIYKEMQDTRALQKADAKYLIQQKKALEERNAARQSQGARPPPKLVSAVSERMNVKSVRKRFESAPVVKTLRSSVPAKQQDDLATLDRMRSESFSEGSLEYGTIDYWKQKAEVNEKNMDRYQAELLALRAKQNNLQQEDVSVSPRRKTAIQ